MRRTLASSGSGTETPSNPETMSDGSAVVKSK